MLNDDYVKWKESLAREKSIPQTENNAYCSALLSNTSLHLQLNESQFDVAVVDLLHNQCGLALARHLELPVVGFWALPFTGLYGF